MFKGIEMLAAKVAKKRRVDIRPMTVICLWGVTTTGKTHRAVRMLQAAYPADDYYMWNATNGAQSYAYAYDGERRVILDDIRGDWFKPSVLLGYLRGFHAHVNICGSGRCWEAETIICTSNEPPHNWYNKDVIGQRTHDALMARFDRIVEVTSREQEIDGLLPCNGNEVTGNTIAVTTPPTE